jgi:hypothetical protein
VNNPITIQENIDAVQTFVDDLRHLQTCLRSDMRTAGNETKSIALAVAVINNSQIITQAERWMVEWRLRGVSLNYRFLQRNYKTQVADF